ncbi:fibronectin type III domain-containing protein [Flavobacterium ajazii]|uniref:fibronectin type III domain-containing protein n=1 Tax=Flavobacterium ajazii TaxID=2692318 RepID=UPI0013D39583|nr:fibronectin type III domain-containing protein [Flavobacterium ajazii]
MKQKFQIILLFLPSFLIGQTIKLPEVIKPSPQASEMIKYIDYPMDLSSGLPSTSIPIYTISSGNLSLPITISYNNPGFKPNEDESGILGLGWNLNAFGIISRSINNEPDENHWNRIIPLKENITGTQTDVLADDADVTLLRGIEKYGLDTSPDIFSYILPNSQNGKFVYSRNTVVSEFKKAVLLPYKPVQIISYPIDKSTLDFYEVTDEKGTLYRFGKSLATGQEVKEYFKVTSNTTNSGDGTTSWLLTEIISANKKDTIYFEYDDVIGPDNYNSISKTNIQYNSHVTLTSCASQGGCPLMPASTKENNIIYTGFQYTQKKITKIIFNSGYVKFSYKSNFYPDHLLDKIEVFSNGINNPIKTFKFNQTKYQKTDSPPKYKYWYKLDEIEFQDTGNLKVNKYSFEYNSAGFPGLEINPSFAWLVNTSSIDYWGFYNGRWTNTNLMPSEFTWEGMWGLASSNMFGSADRSADYTFAQQGALKKITFPTGGERIFEYEGNTDVSERPVGGLRIKSISNKTDGKEYKRTFSYIGYSKVLRYFYFAKHFMSLVTEPSYSYYTNEFVASSSPNLDITFNGRPVVYKKVVEYDGDAIVNNGSIEHLFDTSFLQIGPNFYSRSLLPPSFPWDFKHSSGNLPIFYHDVIFGDVLENETNYYDNKGHLVKKIKNNYSHNLKQNIKGFSCSPLVNYVGGKFWKSGAYNFYNYDIQQLSQKLDSTETTEYLEGNSPIINKEEYKYNDNLFVTEQKSQKSNGRTIISKKVYPDEITTITSLGNDALTSDEFDAVKRLKNSSNEPNGLNKISEVIQTSVYEDINSDGLTQSNELLNVQRTNYKDWGNYNVLPKNTQSLKGVYNSSTNNLQDQIIFNDYYTNGNIKEVSTANGMHIIYIWGYSEQYPIAKIENATFVGLSSGIQTTINTAVTASNNDIDEATENSLRTALNTIRNQFPNAMVNTYTYDPLIGMTSVTDAKGYTTYYTYDSFNRLQKTKDHSSNILNEYSYNYASIPLAPNGLAFSGSTATTLSFVWNAVEGATGYKIYKDGVYVSSTTSTSGTLYGLLSSTSYNVQVLAYNFIGDGALCSPVAMTTAPPIPLPVQPTGLALTSASTTSLNFSWNAVNSATGYKIYLNGTYRSDITSTSGSISGLIPATSYNIQILAYNSSGDGPLCSVVAMSTAAGPPTSSPTGLVFKSASTSAINFSWDALAGASGYKLYVNGAYVSSTTSTSGSVSGLTASTSYSVQVLAYNASGDGTLSSSVSMFTTGTPVFGFNKKSGTYPTTSPASVEGTIFNGSGSTIYVYLVAQSGTATSGSGTAIMNIYGTSINKTGTFTQSGQSFPSTSYVALPSNSTISYYVKGNYFGTTSGSQMILAYSWSPGGALTYWSTSN